MSYYTERSYYLAEKEFLHWKIGLVIFLRKSYYSERRSYYPKRAKEYQSYYPNREKELLPWERSYYLDTLKDNELLPMEGGWVTNLGQKLLLWDRTYYTDTGVATLTYELLLWQRGVINLRAELLPLERWSYYLLHWERGVTAVREKDLIPWQITQT